MRRQFHPSLALPTIKAAFRKVDTSYSKKMRIHSDHETLTVQQVHRNSEDTIMKSKKGDGNLCGGMSWDEDSTPSKPQYMCHIMCSKAFARDDAFLLSRCCLVAERISSGVDSRPCHGVPSHASNSTNSILVADPPNTRDGMARQLGEECSYQAGDKLVLNHCEDAESLDSGADCVCRGGMDMKNFHSSGCKTSLSNLSPSDEQCGLVVLSADNQNGNKSCAVLCAQQEQTSEFVDLEGGPLDAKPSIPSTLQTERDVVDGEIWTDEQVPDQQGLHGVFMHISTERLKNMRSNNLLSLCKQESYLLNLSRQLCRASNRHGRSAPPHLSDLAGKLPLALKLMSLEFSENNVIIDAAHAHGPCEMADGFLVEANSFLEVKGSGPKHRKNQPASSDGHHQYTVHHLRLNMWRLLIIVLRPQDPGDWTRAENFDEFWLGVITREEFIAEYGIPPHEKDYVVTPNIPDESTPRLRSAFSKIVHWVKFRDLTAEWWKENVLKPLNNNRQLPIQELDL